MLNNYNSRDLKTRMEIVKKIETLDEYDNSVYKFYLDDVDCTVIRSEYPSCFDWSDIDGFMIHIYIPGGLDEYELEYLRKNAAINQIDCIPATCTLCVSMRDDWHVEKDKCLDANLCYDYIEDIVNCLKSIILI